MWILRRLDSLKLRGRAHLMVAGLPRTSAWQCLCLIFWLQAPAPQSSAKPGMTKSVDSRGNQASGQCGHSCVLLQQQPPSLSGSSAYQASIHSFLGRHCWYSRGSCLCYSVTLIESSQDCGHRWFKMATGSIDRLGNSSGARSIAVESCDQSHA